LHGNTVVVNQPDFLFEELILSTKLDEERYAQYKKQTESTLKKVVVALVVLFLFIIVSSFFI
jgi:hypothetical protein